MELYKKFTTKPYSFLVIDAILASDNPLRCRRNLVKRISKLIMAIVDNIRDEKLQYNIIREAAKKISFIFRQLINILINN